MVSWFIYAQPVCLHCHHPTLCPIACIDSEGTPHGSSTHTFVYRYTNLALCTACHALQFECCAHDCWSYHEDEPWDLYWWYNLLPPDAMRLWAYLMLCRHPFVAQCSCRIHRQLRASINTIAHPLRASPRPLLGNEPVTTLELHLMAGRLALRLPH